MSRQRGTPDHIVAKLRLTRGYEFFWQVIRDLDRRGPWTASDVEARSSADHSTVHEYVRRLAKGGFVEAQGKRPGSHPGYAAPLYRLVRDGREAPRLRSDGTVLPEPGQETIWRAAKMLKSFTLVELHTSCGGASNAVSYAAVRRYARHLADAGIFSELRRGGRPQQAKYLVARNLGGKAPQILRAHIVFDPNSNQVIGIAEASETP
ncbi:MAG TPA: hypothetical protein VIJ42_09220 [Stellaceae bacterium]